MTLIQIGLTVLMAVSPFFLYADENQLNQVIKEQIKKSPKGCGVSKKVSSLAEETGDLVHEYEVTLHQIESLRSYNQQTKKLIEDQKREMSSIRVQIEEVKQTGKDIVPLMLEMTKNLKQFITLDLPFLMKERKKRLEEIKKIMDRADISVSEKYRRVMEAYQVENEYGKTLEAYQSVQDMEGKSINVNYLRVGRIALVYQTMDGKKQGYWNQHKKQWISLSSRYSRAVESGLKVARKQQAPTLLTVPVSAPIKKGGSIVNIKNVSLLYLFWSSLLSVFSFSAQANTLDDLLKKVMEERRYESQEFQKRESQFKTERDKRKGLLEKALKELKKEERISERLTAEFEKNEKDLAILENELNLAVGTLGELFGVVKQVAGDFRGQVLNSLVSAEIPGREKFAGAIAARKKLPTTKELRQLWFEIQREMTEQGKVTRFEEDVISLDGEKSKRLITRVGAFNLVSGGQYLNYQGERIVELVKQPEKHFTRYIDDLENAQENTYPIFALDPSRGSLISILIRVPGVFERIRQGGIVGWVIICVLLFGLSLVVERWIVIMREEKKITVQLKQSSEPKEDNPVGQILSVYEKNKNLDMESLEMKLNEIAIKYLPKVERGIGTIKLLAVLAPLLGLLGTVTGMIMTFQSITLFGTGDPKLMAGGISQALVTTVMGLCCAIPLLLCHNFISRPLSKTGTNIGRADSRPAGPGFNEGANCRK